jgi:hypothetical protein
MLNMCYITYFFTKTIARNKILPYLCIVIFS